MTFLHSPRNKNALHASFELGKESHLITYPILSEVRIRLIRLFIGLGLTWSTCYWFPEDLIFPLAKPLLSLPLDSYFICTQLTEALSTYLATSSVVCSYFAFLLIGYQLWSFLIPSCYLEERRKYKFFFYLSAAFLLLSFFLTSTWIVPNLWHFLSSVSGTSTSPLLIKLEPRIYDYIMLTFRILFVPSLCSQIPIIVICLLELGVLSIGTLIENRRFLLVFSLLGAALATPPDVGCQIIVFFILSSLLELAIFVASIIQARDKRKGSPTGELG